MMRHEYVQAAIRTAPALGTIDEQLTLAGIGIAGEAIEVFEVAIQRTIDRPKLLKELGDVCWYSALVCENIGVNFEQLCAADRVATFTAAGFGNRYEALDAHVGVLLVSAKNVSEFLKKQVFHKHPADNLTLEMLVRKLVRSIQVIAAWTDASIDEVLTLNIDKLKARYPERFTTEASLNKDESKEG